MLKKEVSQLNLVDLPDELLLAIMDWLDIKQLNRIKRLNKRCYGLACDKRFALKALVSAYRAMPEQIKALQQDFDTIHNNLAEHYQKLDRLINKSILYSLAACFPIMLLANYFMWTSVLSYLPDHYLPNRYLCLSNFFIILLAFIGPLAISMLLIFLIGNRYKAYAVMCLKMSGITDSNFNYLCQIQNRLQLILQHYQPFLKACNPKLRLDAEFLFDADSIRIL